MSLTNFQLNNLKDDRVSQAEKGSVRFREPASTSVRETTSVKLDYFQWKDVKTYWKQCLYLVFLLIAYTAATFFYTFYPASFWLNGDNARMGGPTFYILFLSLFFWFPELPEKIETPNEKSTSATSNIDKLKETKKSKAARVYYLDNLKTYLTICVYFGHCLVETSITAEELGVSEEEAIAPFDPELSATLQRVNLWAYDLFFNYQTMPMFMFIAGTSVSRSFKKKGVHRFLKDKFIRLGSALLLNTYGYPVIYVLLQLANGWEANYIATISTGLAWFLQVLLTLDIIYVVLEKYVSRVVLPLPNVLGVFLFGFVISIMAEAERFNAAAEVGFGAFASGSAYSSTFWINIVFFFSGVVASQGQWIEQLRHAPTWHKAATYLLWLGYAVVVTCNFFVIDFSTFPLEGPAFFFYSVFYKTLARFIYSWALLMLFANHFNFTNKLLSSLAKAAYGVYLFQFVLGILWFQTIWAQILIPLYQSGNTDPIPAVFYSRKPVYMVIYMLYSWPMVLLMKKLPFFKEWL